MKKTNDNIHDQHSYMLLQDSVVYCNPIINKVMDDKADTLEIDDDTLKHAKRKIQFLKHYEDRRTDNTSMFIDIIPEDIESSLANLQQIVFEVTDSCNLKCKYCGYGEFYDDYDSRHNKFLDFSNAKLFLDYMILKWNSPLNTSHGADLYISFYGGEPLMNMKFIRETVSYMENVELKHNTCHFSMTTNAMLLNKYIPYLVEHNFRLLISLDGDKAGHSYRVTHNGKNSFDKVYKNIKLIQKKYPDYFETQVSFNSVLHNHNSVGGIYHFIKENFDKVPAISELNNSGIRKEKQDEFFATFQNLSESLYQSEDYSRIKKDMFMKVGETRDVGLFLLKNSGNIFLTYNDLFAKKEKTKRTPTGTCMPFGKKMFVTVNGKILPCERVSHQYKLGCIDSDRVNLEPEKIAEIYNNYFNKLKKQCNYCYNADACMQCMFQLNNLDKNPVCLGFVNKIDFDNLTNYNMHYLCANPDLYDKIIEEMIIKN